MTHSAGHLTRSRPGTAGSCLTGRDRAARRLAHAPHTRGTKKGTRSVQPTQAIDLVTRCCGAEAPWRLTETSDVGTKRGPESMQNMGFMTCGA